MGFGGQLPRHRQARWGERGAGRLAPQKDWEVNNPAELAGVVRALEEIQRDFNSSQSGGKRVSLADLIVLGGCAAVEQAAKNAGHDLTVPFAPGRTDALQEQTDVESFAVLEPTADGFRNYLRAGEKAPAEHLLVERANLLTLTAPQMTVLVGGMRALNANFGHSGHGVFTSRPETLTNDFFVNLLDMSTEWKASASSENVFEGRDRATGEVKWTGTAVDLVFGSNSQLRAISEVYASDDSKARFVARLRGCVGQGHEPRSLRSCLTGSRGPPPDPSARLRTSCDGHQPPPKLVNSAFELLQAPAVNEHPIG